MISQFIFFVALTMCTEPLTVNTSTEKWNAHDSKSLEFNKDRCVVHYKDAPCVKYFIKKKPQTYWVVCGGKHE